MARTVKSIGNDKKQFQIITDRLHCYIKAKGFFSSRFQGNSNDSIILECANPKKGPGDDFTFRLKSKSKGNSSEPVYDNAHIEGREAKLLTPDSVRIGQFRETVNIYRSKFRNYSCVQLGKNALAEACEKFIRAIDAMIFHQLTGEHRNDHSSRLHKILVENESLNSLRLPNTNRQLFPGNVTCESSLTLNHKFSMHMIHDAKNYARQLGQNPNAERMRPIRIDGSEYFALVIHPYQKHDLCQEIGHTGWKEIRGNLCKSEVRKHGIAHGALGLVDGIILYANWDVVTYKGGASSSVDCASGLLLGQQAGAIAYGGLEHDMRTSFQGELRDYENMWSFALDQIMGFNKCQIGSDNLDSGVIRLDTVAGKPA